MVLGVNHSGERIYKEPEINKAKDFIDFLIADTGLKSGSPIVCEKMIVKFLEENASGLKQLFRNTGLYPAMKTDLALELIYRNLYGRVSENVLPVINRFIEDADFSFLDKISSAGTVWDDFRKVKLHDFVQMMFSKRSARFRMNGVYNIFYHQVMGKYTAEIFRRKGFLYGKLFTEQNIAGSREEFVVLLKVLLLIKNAANMEIPYHGLIPDMNVRITDAGPDRERLSLYIDSLMKYAISFLPGFPEPVIDIAIKSNLPDEMTGSDEYICKYLYILNARFQYFENIVKPDRGAESPDKSWFNIAAKNPAYFGYNKEVIEALQIIAGENNW